MKVILYGRILKSEFQSLIQELVHYLEKKEVQLLVHQTYHQVISGIIQFEKEPELIGANGDLQKKGVDAVLSLGGDGTLLNTLTFIKDSQIPVLGINLGNLGFLSTAPAEKMFQAIDALLEKNYHVEDRQLLEVKGEPKLFEACPLALNEFTIYRQETSSMLTIRVKVNEKDLATYFADGIIVSTPTGSTGYSISCGGPVVHPLTNSLIITPVAPHNLNVRPVVIPADSKITIQVEGRGDYWIATLDSRYQRIDSQQSISLSKSAFPLKLIRIEEDDFFQTLSTKMHWGKDERS